MGYTQFTIDLISRHLEGVKSVLDYGSQNVYAGVYDPNYPPFASEWYDIKGIRYTCIDLAGDNGALQLNWSYPINPDRLYDLVVDSGSSEHSIQTSEYDSVAFHNGHINSVYPKGEPTPDEIAKGFYNCWLNKHNFCKIGGLIISENPHTGNWPGHGYTYITEGFYHFLSVGADYQIIELGTHAAMGNTKDGLNVYSVIRKTSETFPTFDEFQVIPV